MWKNRNGFIKSSRKNWVWNLWSSCLRPLAPCGTRHSFSCTSLADAAVLNNVAHTFGLMDTVKKVLDNRKNQTEQGEEQFLYTLAGRVTALASHPLATLGNQCDLSLT